MKNKRGNIIVGIGILLLIAAFVILTLTDREGQNWASAVSPVLFVMSWILITVGLISK